MEQVEKRIGTQYGDTIPYNLTGITVQYSVYSMVRYSVYTVYPYYGTSYTIYCAQYSTVQGSTVQYNVQCSTVGTVHSVQCSTVGTVQHSAVRTVFSL